MSMPADPRIGDAVLAEVHALVDDLRSVPAVKPYQETIDRLVADLHTRPDQERPGLLVCLVGSSGAGKSTLVNALVGAEIAREGVDRPTTDTPTIYAPDDLDDRTLPATGGANIMRYPVSEGAPWSGHVLIDAPDVNSYATRHRALTKSLAEAADVLLVVMHHQSVAEASPVEFLDNFTGRRDVVFVLGRCDEFPEHSRLRLIEQIRQLAATRWDLEEIQVFAISAKQAQREPSAAGDFPDLIAYLKGIENALGAARIRRDRVAGAARQLAAVLAPVKRELADAARQIDDDLDHSIEALSTKVASEVMSRLAPYRNDFEAVLAAELAMQWRGPIGAAFGIANRGLISLGFGALMARRHPLLAAGMYVGEQVVGAQQHAVSKRRLTEPMWDEQFLKRIEDWCSASESVLRLRTHQLKVGDLSFSEPLIKALGRRADQDWGERMLDMLPTVARRALPAWMRRLLDLPMYLLGAWVLFRTGKGVLVDDLVGLDLVVTAAILGLAWILAAVTIGRRRSRRAAGQWLEEAKQNELGQFEAAVNEARHSMLAQLRSALGALSRLGAPVTSWSVTHRADDVERNSVDAVAAWDPVTGP